MSILMIVAVALVLAFVLFAGWVRFAPNDASVWHVDPVTAPNPSTPNFARVDQTTSLAPLQAAAALAAQAQSEGAVRIAGEDLFGTWMVRTRVMGYPDFVSIRVTPTGHGAQVVALSRSRFGYSDQGVNRARLRRWMAALPQE